MILYAIIILFEKKKMIANIMLAGVTFLAAAVFFLFGIKSEGGWGFQFWWCYDSNKNYQKKRQHRIKMDWIWKITQICNAIMMGWFLCKLWEMSFQLLFFFTKIITKKVKILLILFIFYFKFNTFYLSILIKNFKVLYMDSRVVAKKK